jgi:hypothetical protein
MSGPEQLASDTKPNGLSGAFEPGSRDSRKRFAACRISSVAVKFFFA